MNTFPAESFQPPEKIATLVNRQRDGLLVFAFCPICDHAEEARDQGGGQEQTQSDSIAKIKLHIRKIHRSKQPRIKISITRR